MDELLLALTLIFVVAAALLLVAARFEVPVIPFYLLAGVLAGVAIDESQLLDLAQWGIAFLVFLFGVHVDLGAVRSTGRISALVGLGQSAIVGGFVLGAGLLVGLDPLNAGYLAVAAALSSSMVATSYLGVTEGSRPPFERLAESIHFVEDLLGVVVIVALGAFVYAADPAPVQLAVAGGLLAVALLVRYACFHRLTARLQGDPEVLMLVGVSFVVGGIAVAEVAGLSIVVGAFAAGIAVADDYPHSLELVDTVDDLEDFFSPIFFVTVGALVSIPDLATVGYALGLVAVVLLVNPLVVAVLVLRTGLDGRTAVLTGYTLDHVGAFALFVAIEAAVVGTIDAAVFDAIVLAAVVTMIAATYTARHRETIARRLRESGVLRALGETTDTGDRTSVDDELRDHVIVVDAARGGRHVVEACRSADRPLLVIEDDPTHVDEVRDLCDHVVYGDVLDDRVWELARLDDAALVVSLAPEPDRARCVVYLAVDVPRVVRADDHETADRFRDRGADGVLSPDAVAADRVAGSLLALLDGEIDVEAFRERSRVGERTDDQQPSTTGDGSEAAEN